MKILLLISLFIVYGFMNAIIINIPANQPTIQAGIIATTIGDTVLVQPGTYVENIDYEGRWITVGSLFLTTQDKTYISQTIIDGNQIDRVVTFESYKDTTAVLSGFTITNGYAQGATYSGRGGGISCQNSSPKLEYLNIVNNESINRHCTNSGFRMSIFHFLLDFPNTGDIFVSKNTLSVKYLG